MAGSPKQSYKNRKEMEFSMKTILFFSWQHLWSMKNKAGAPSYHHTISYYIESDEWDVYLFSADDSNKELKTYLDGKVFLFRDSEAIEKISTVSKINHLSLPIKHRHFTKWAVRKASDIIDKTDGEIVLYGYEVWGVEAARQLSEKYGLPLVTRFQGTIISYEKHSLLNRLIHYPHYGALETKADLVIMTDDGTMGDKTLKELGNTSHTLFLRNGLDLYENYELIHRESDRSRLREEMGIAKDEHILLMASRLTSWKRVDRGIWAVKALRERMDNVRLLIAGDGDSRAGLESLAKELKVDDIVQFLGSIPQSRLYRYMIAADVFLSLYDLGNLGNPTFEAMLMRKAIITLNGGATASVIHHNENGILLEYSEEKKIPDAIEAVLTDETLKKRIEDGAYSFAVENFYSWGTRMKVEEDAIAEIVKEHH